MGPESRLAPALQLAPVLRLAQAQWLVLVALLQLARAQWLGLAERWLLVASLMKMGWLWARGRTLWSQLLPAL